ncbi:MULTISPECIES: DUF4436 family protein [Pseudanabaena]|uniref:DUF4436 domain-containing protein n=2 Tax=Pseudanabaena TaxID=1152 RepID=L8N6B0_9CYAN|nr:MULTISPECIES: DUF4436 family protein [Pseudanabaena]ELS34674.1 hypothetical protein Pse7429DRAFT_0131 [Pseudanabaena biceps PCC 7429]MDG3493110.1 DUF4436 family protein [Pseudanabaena catenata USMAC16]
MEGTARKLLGKRIILILLFLALFIGAFSSALYFYQNDRTQRSADLVFGDDKIPNRLDVDVSLLAIDPIKGELTLRFAPKPEGTYSTKEFYLTKDLKFFTGIESGKSEVTLEKNHIIDSVTGTISIVKGRVSDYPFDSHVSDLYIFFTNPKDEKEEIPILVNFYGAVSGYNVDADYIPKNEFQSTDEVKALRINISRSIITKSFSIFLMLAMWLIGLVIFTMSMVVLWQPRPIEFGMFTLIAGMLFALPAVRNLQPGVPPLGGLSDFLSFFWAESLVALSLPILFFTWLVRYKPPS